MMYTFPHITHVDQILEAIEGCENFAVNAHNLSFNAAIAKAKEHTSEEGFVIGLPNGHMLKAKSEWYVTLHRSKEAVAKEKDLMKYAG